MSLPILSEPDAQELATLLADAKGANDCLDWLHHCAAACCKQFSIPDRGYNLQSAQLCVQVGKMSVDDRWYYQLHGCTYRSGVLFIPAQHCVRKDGKIIIVRRCDFLTEENKCSAHDGKRPKVCSEYTLETLKNNKTTAYSPIRCLFKYKILLEKQEGTL